MSAGGRRRRVAAMLVRWAGRALPGSRKSWADAMRNELEHVPGAWPAVRWALGCLVAACRERIGATRIADRAAVRVAIGGLIALKIFDDLFATLLTIVYKTSALGAAARLGRLAPGDDYRRLIPLMDAVPAWLHGLWLLAAGLYLVAMLGLALRKGSPAVFVLAALAIEMAANAASGPIMAATGVVVPQGSSPLAGVVLPFLLPMMLAVVLWMLAGTPNPRGHATAKQ